MKNKKYLLYIVLFAICFISSFIINQTTNMFLNSVLNLVKVVAIVVLCFIFITKIVQNKEEEEISWKEFFLISSISIYMPLHFCITNIMEISFAGALSICFISYFLFLASYILINLLIKNKNKTLILGIIFSISCVVMLNDVVVPLILFVLSEVSVIKIRKPLCVFSGILLIMELSLFVWNGGSFLYNNHKKHMYSKELNIDNYINGKSKNRDIYIIVLDMYSGADVLKKKWGFDNLEFINALKSRGFYVFDKMFSNYNYTYTSLPAMVNLTYFDCKKYKNTSLAINDGLVFKIAKKQGYETHYGNDSWFKIRSEYIDYVHSSAQIRELVKETGVSFYTNDVFRNFFEKVIEIIFQSEEEKSIEIQDTKSKKFVFIHKLAPHDPFKYDENGKEIEPLEERGRPFLYKNYLPYLKYTNKKTIEFIDKLLSEKENPPVIVITGDHGIREKDIFDSMFSTFTAYYNPEKEYQHISSSKTLISFFINFYQYELNAKIDSQKDKMFYLEFIDGPTDTNICFYMKNVQDVSSKYFPQQ